MPQSASQPLTLELSTTLDLAETSALDYYAWHVVPFAGENYLVSIGYYLAPEVRGGLQLTVAASIRLPPYTDSGETCLSQLITDLGAPSIVSVAE